MTWLGGEESGALSAERRLGRAYEVSKRIVDVLGASACLLIAAPLMAAVAIAVKLDTPGPAIFRQERVCTRKGKDGSRQLGRFTFYKFRSMYHRSSDDLHRRYVQAFIGNDERGMASVQEQARQMAGGDAQPGADQPAHGDANGVRKLTCDPRVTRVGSIIRRTSLDELPQLWNVLKGDMSLVGPRPALPYEVEVYQDWHHGRLLAKPGMTGLWQVAARSAATFEEMAALDVWYVEHRSFWLDLRILVRTPLAVLAGRGAC